MHPLTQPARVHVGALLLEFVAYGDPAPQGSKNAIPIYRGKGATKEFTGRVNLKESSDKVEPWRTAVRQAALRAMRGRALDHRYPVIVDMVFTRPRPARRPAWWPKEWEWSANADTVPACTPDLSKLARSTEDAISATQVKVGKRKIRVAGVLADDKLILDYGRLVKVYPGRDPDSLDRPGAVVRVWEWVPGPPCPGIV